MAILSFPANGSPAKSLVAGAPYYNLAQKITMGTVTTLDYYPIGVSAQAVAIGSRSDIDKVLLEWIDPVSGTTMFNFASVDAPFVGRLPSDLKIYPLATVNFSAAFFPNDLTLDLLVYFAPPNQPLPQKRGPVDVNSVATATVGGVNMILQPALGWKRYGFSCAKASADGKTVTVKAYAGFYANGASNEEQVQQGTLTDASMGLMWTIDGLSAPFHRLRVAVTSDAGTSDVNYTLRAFD